MKFTKEQFKLWYLYATLFVSGAFVLVIEIVGARMLAPFYGSTIFVWSSLIAVTLGFLALGYFIGGRVADKRPDERWFYAIVFVAAAVTLLLVKISAPILEASDGFGLRAGPLAAALALFASSFFLLGMVDPYAIRLRTKDIAHSGHVAGGVFATTTVGSLAGALLAGFYLIPNFFIEDIFTGAAAVVMAGALAGFFFAKTSHTLTSSMFVILILLAFTGSATRTPHESVTVIHRSPSLYGEITVAEREGIRCLVVGGVSQSCLNEKNGYQAFLYGYLVTSLFDEQKDLKHALVIGLGGGVLARDLSPYFETVDVVEIDPVMERIAEAYFGYDDSSAKLSTIIMDGRRFLKETEETYDAIIVDAFSGTQPAPHLYTQEAFAKMGELLSPEGLLIVNTLGWAYGEETKLTHAVAKTVGSVFPYVGVLSSENVRENPTAFGNVLFIASKEEKLFPIREEFIVYYDKEDIENGELLRDGRNPIQTLGFPVFVEAQRGFQELWGVL